MMDPLLGWARKNQSAVIEVIREFVECESPSDSPAAVHRFMDLLGESVSDIAVSRLEPRPERSCLQVQTSGREQERATCSRSATPIPCGPSAR